MSGPVEPIQVNLRAERFAVLKATAKCHACHADTRVSALMVPAFQEFDGEEWRAQDDSALLIYVEGVDASSWKVWNDLAPWVRLAPSKTAGITYLANVCLCGALQGDFYLIEPGAPFFPLDDAGLAAIEVEWVETPIEASADTSQSSWTDQLIERFPYHGWVPAPMPPKKRVRNHRGRS